MRLTEDRLNSISEKIAARLLEKKMVVTRGSLGQLTSWIEKPILEDLMREDAIDEEVRRYISGLSNPPPEGSFDYQALFRKKKDEVARRRGFQS